MKRLALLTATVAMTGTMAMTSQAAVGTYVIGGNCGTGNSFGNNGCNIGNDCSLGSGSGCSVDQILQMIFSGSSDSGCSNSWTDSCAPITGGCQDVLVPNLPGPNYPGSSDCPGSSGCPGSSDCSGSGTEIPDIPNIGIQKPVNPNPDIPNPGTPGTDNQNSGNQNPGTQNPGTQNPGTQNPGGQGTGQDSSYVQQVIDLVNEERAKAGLSPVEEASDVSAAAAVRAQEITQSFSHTRPNGSNFSTALDQAGARYMGSGENIAYGQRTPQDVMNGWMNSQGHRANILNGSYKKIGVGYYQNANGVGYWVQLFTY